MPDNGRYFRAFDVFALSPTTSRSVWRCLARQAAGVPLLAHAQPRAVEGVGIPFPLGDVADRPGARSTCPTLDEQRAACAELMLERLHEQQ